VEAAANEVVGAESDRRAAEDSTGESVEAAATEVEVAGFKRMTAEDAAAVFVVEMMVSMMAVSLVK
jgi:hypothetical protein